MNPYYERDGITIYHGDCMKVLAELADVRFSTIITDPPYGLKFMGKAWDHGVPGEMFWKRFSMLCHPGAMLLSFGGTRTWHRLAVAMEDAGWEIRDTLMYLYGTGFPKSHDIGKAIDKAAGAEREIVGKRTSAFASHSVASGAGFRPGEACSIDVPLTGDPATPAAQLWDGYGTALKPAFEPILLCRAPLTAVPLDAILSEVQNLIGGALCLLLSNANNAERISELSPLVQSEVSVSALMLAAMLHGAESGELYERMDMFSSRELVLTCLNIASLWSSILDAALNHGNTFTTSMVDEMTIGLKTLKYLLSTNIPVEVIQAVFLPVGSQSSAPAAGVDSSVGKESTKSTRRLFVTALASLSTYSSGTTVKNATSDLQAIIPSVVSVLRRVLIVMATESDAPELRELANTVGASSGQSHQDQPFTATRNVWRRITPSYKPIILAMNPLDGTYANNALKHGVAGLNVDGGRVGTEQIRTHGKRDGTGSSLEWSKYKSSEDYVGGVHRGRWPSNLLLDGSEEVLAGFPESKGFGGFKPGAERKASRGKGGYHGNFPTPLTTQGHSDSGSAARYFYCAKASRAERTCNGAVENSHPTVKPLALMEYLCKLTMMPTNADLVLDPFMGSGSTLVACIRTGRAAVGIDSDEAACEIAAKRVDNALDSQKEV